MLLIYLQVASSVATVPLCSTTETKPSWKQEIVKYLQMGELPNGEKHAQNLYK